MNEEFKCFTKCPKDCTFDYFMWDNIKKEFPTGIAGGKSFTKINLEHNRLPDIIVSHYPEITFIGFISNFGGLLGLWLGLNVLTIFDDVLKIIQFLIDRKQQIFNIFQSNKKMTIKIYHGN